MHFVGLFLYSLLKMHGPKNKKAIISFVLSVSPSVCVEQLGSTERISIKFDIWVFLSKVCRENSSLLKSDKNNKNAWRPVYIYDHISFDSHRMKNVSDNL